MPNEQPEDLGEQIARAQAAREAKEAAKRKGGIDGAGNVSAGAYALRFGVEIVACVFVGGFMGYWIDRFAGTAPWGLLVVGALGIAAGIRGMVRAYHELNAAAREYSSGPEAPPDRKTDE